MRLLATLSIALALNACGVAPDALGDGDGPSPSAVFFPVMKPADAVPAGALSGVVRLRAGCLWIERANQGRTEAFLVLWPAGSRLVEAPDGLLVRDPGGNILARMGDEVRTGGGETHDVSFVTELTGQSPPTGCRSGEAYWRAYQFLPVD